MPRIKRQTWVYYECPHCGPKTRFSMPEGAYKGGGCEGLNPSHKFKNYVEVERKVEAK